MRWLALPLAPLYRFVVWARSFAYRKGWLRRVRLDVPVISVGNLTFGGTGKTPVVITLVQELLRHGRAPAVLTRGYGRSGNAPLLVIGPDAVGSAAAAGDEPLELAHRLPGIPIVIDKDRVRSGERAIAAGADILVLDDGFQHLRLERDLDLVLIDAGDPWGGNALPPRGRLREPVQGVRRASAVLVTKLHPGDSETLDSIKQRLAMLAPGCAVFAARARPTALRTPEGLRAPEELAGKRVVACAGIGRPQAFVELVEEVGAEVVATRFFRDHHRYHPREIREVLELAARSSARVVTTAKDAVKLGTEQPFWVLEMQMSLIDATWEEVLLAAGILVHREMS